MISVAIPAFKAKFLREAIKSILDQTYSNYELIIVNDASQDNIREIVESFNDSRIRYYENEVNLGKESVVKNWNKCLEYAKGEYFILFSDDDICDKHYLEKMYNLINKYPNINLAHCRLATIDENDNLLNVANSCPEYEEGIEFIWHRMKGVRLQAAPDFMVKTSALKAIGGFIDLALAWGSDDLTWFQLSLEYGVAYTNEVLVYWRLSKINISKVGAIKERLDAIIKYDEYCKKKIFTAPHFITHPYKSLIQIDYTRWIYNLRYQLISYAQTKDSLIFIIIRNYKKLDLKVRDLLMIIIKKWMNSNG